MKKVLVIGSTVADIILQVPHLPTTCEDINLTHQEMKLGGCAYNVANILSMFHVPYTLFSPIGIGIYGDFVRQELTKRKMDTPFLCSNEKNGCCFCFVEESGERTFLSDHGAEYRFQKEWFSQLDSDAYDTIYVCGLEVEDDEHHVLLSFLQDHKKKTIYFAPGPRILHIPHHRLETLFSLSPILHLNETEALSYTNCEHIEEASHVLYQKTQNTVLITLGD